MDDFAGPSFHSARWDPTTSTSPGTRFALDRRRRQRLPDRARRSPTRSSSSRSSSAPRSGCSRTRLPRARCPTVTRWAMRHLPFYGRWFRFLMFYPASAFGIEPLPHRSRLRRQRRAARSARPTPRRARAVRRVDRRRSSTTGPTCSTRSMPDYPPSAKRTLQDNGSWLACLQQAQRRARAHRHRAHRRRRRRHRRRHAHAADVICYATGFRHNDFLAPMDVIGRGGISLREQWGDEPTAYLGITVPELPEPVLPLRAGHEPGPRRAACSSTPSARSTTSMEAIRAGARRAAPRDRGPPPTCTTTTPSATSARSASSCGPTRSMQAQPLQEPRRARSSRCRRGRSPCTGSGPRPSTPTTTRSRDRRRGRGRGVAGDPPRRTPRRARARPRRAARPTARPDPPAGRGRRRGLPRRGHVPGLVRPHPAAPVHAGPGARGHRHRGGRRRPRTGGRSGHGRVVVPVRPRQLRP